ncbi:response regulator [Gemmata sp. JC717]|uniref:response regulator n=1 Tax=Gemmata algarum TaxID=2975278 RepID=UPI0021BA44E3|nr:response regulator [Gemmata algarum]MDY3551774.1 response regulator [Gemmata algarum]
MSTPAPAPVHFLLVDDLEENLLALEGLLRRDGLTLLKARSGPAALELLLVHEVALAFVDVRMPGMDGFELAELMRGTERTRRVPIIFLTAGTPDQQRRFRGYETGAVDFLTKPLEAHVVQSKADVFFELWRERQEVARQRDELKLIAAENARLLAETQRTAEALREADRRKDEFLATLAHELRNPLAPMRNGVHLMSVGQPDGPARARTLAMMERQLGQMVHLVDDLLDVARFSSGKIVLRKERLELAPVLGTAVETSRPLIEVGRHELTVDVPAEPLLLDGDRTRLTQIFANLLNNAAKYTPKGGRITLAAAREGERAVVRVTDNGIGISAEMLPQVFDLFTQVGSAVDRAQGGLGIGLTLVKRLVALHGGEIAAHSAGEGKGSEFVVRLPLVNRPAAAEPAASVAAPPEPRLKGGAPVLIVDDNLDAAESLAELLEMKGHTVRTARDGAEAIRVLGTFRPRLVLLDLGLPGMSGYELAERLRDDPALSGVALAALTGWGKDEDRRRTKEAGFDYHFVKPADLSQVDAVLAGLGQ